LESFSESCSFGVSVSKSSSVEQLEKNIKAKAKVKDRYLGIRDIKFNN
jgi:hypothetical protein